MLAKQSGVALVAAAVIMVAAAPANAATYTLISRNSANAGSGQNPAISNDGGVIAFATASSLVSADTNNAYDVYAKSVSSGALTLVSASASGVVGDAASAGSAAAYGDAAVDISGNGRYVTFPSRATNLVAGDTNGAIDVFRKDLTTGAMVLVSQASSVGNGTSGDYGQSVSDDGNLVAFTSTATNLVSGDTNGARDVFVKNISTGSVQRASLTSGGVQANSSSDLAQISGDGTRVAFRSLAFNLTSGVGASASYNFYVRTLASATTSRITMNTGSGSASIGGGLGISQTGQYVVFSTNESYVAADTDGTKDVYVRDLSSGSTTLASVTSSGTQTNESTSEAGANSGYEVSANGSIVTFPSATVLSADDANTSLDVYQKNLSTNGVVRVSSGTNGTAASGNFGISATPTGAFVAFQSSNSFSSADTGGSDVYRWN